MRYKSKRSYEWSAKIAYAVGLMTSDGCLYNDGRHLCLVSKDIEQLCNFMDAIGRELKIARHVSGEWNEAFHIQFGDVAFYDFLLEAGLTPKKSLILNKVNVPDDYYSDFLRGLFDGDGSNYGYKDRRWKNSFMFYTTFISGSYKFLEWLNDSNIRLVNTSKINIKMVPRAFALNYAKNDSIKLFEYMYYDKNIIALNRKYFKYINFFEADPYVNILR